MALIDFLTMRGSRLSARLVKSVILNKLNGGAMRRKRDSRVNGRSFAAVFSAESGGSLPPDGTSYIFNCLKKEKCDHCLKNVNRP